MYDWASVNVCAVLSTIVVNKILHYLVEFSCSNPYFNVYTYIEFIILFWY